MAWPRHAAVAVAAYVAVRAVGLAAFVVAALLRDRDAHATLVSWDGQWYRGIAENGYGLTRLHPDGRVLSDYAFFPLFPWLERGLARVSGLAAVDAGLVLSVGFSLAAALGIYAVTAHLYDGRTGVLCVVLWAALPVAAVQWMPYTESLFTALAAWALLCTLKRWWLLAALLASLAGLTRPVGVAVVAAVVVAAGVSLARDARAGDGGSASRVVAIVLAPLGLLGYLAWVGHRLGSPLGYFEVTEGWANSFDGGVAFTRWTLDLITRPPYVTGVLVVLGVAALLGLLVVCVRQRQPLPLLVLAGCIVALTLTTSGYFGSKPRYLLPAFPLLLPVALWLARQRTRVAVALVASLVAATTAYGAVWLLGPGPP